MEENKNGAAAAAARKPAGGSPAARVQGFLRREPVLCAAALCALGTMLLVPPSRAYAAYIDCRVLALLFCLMAVVAGLRGCGAFDALARALLARCKSGRALGAVLVLLPFFCSMLITNDVALLTFIPFTLLLTASLGLGGREIPLLVLQTIAANLGSMATPVGNPQNLYLYTAYALSAGDFFRTLLPYTLASGVLLALGGALALPKTLAAPELGAAPRPAARQLAFYGALFALCLLSVFRVLPWPILLGVLTAALALKQPSLLARPDYGLLATFVCFFIVSGNLSALPAVRTALSGALARGTVLTAAAVSQIISNVPAAVLLSGFTQDWRGLLLGTNLGGLGTPVASLASLITLKAYFAAPGARRGRYLAVFSALNFALLALGLAFAA